MVLSPLAPSFWGRGAGVRGQSASRWRSRVNLRTWPRVPTLAPSSRERVFERAAAHPQPFSPGKPGGEGRKKDSIATGGVANTGATIVFCGV